MLCNTCRYIGRTFINNTDRKNLCNNGSAKRLHQNVWNKPVCEQYEKYYCSIENSQQAADAKKAGL